MTRNKKSEKKRREKKKEYENKTPFPEKNEPCRNKEKNKKDNPYGWW